MAYTERAEPTIVTMRYGAVPAGGRVISVSNTGFMQVAFPAPEIKNEKNRAQELMMEMAAAYVLDSFESPRLSPPRSDRVFRETALLAFTPKVNLART